MARFKLQFSHLNEHMFKHTFRETISPMCACGAEVETTEHLPLRCQLYSAQRSEIFDKCQNVNPIF